MEKHLIGKLSSWVITWTQLMTTSHVSEKYSSLSLAGPIYIILGIYTAPGAGG